MSRESWQRGGWSSPRDGGLEGSWAFANTNSPGAVRTCSARDPFTNATLSTNHVSISIPTSDRVFALEGDMAGDSFAGFFRWHGTNRGPWASSSPLGRTRRDSAQGMPSSLARASPFAGKCRVTGLKENFARVLMAGSPDLFGEGSFTNAALVGDRITINIPASNQVFTIEGEMEGDRFAGFFRSSPRQSPDRDVLREESGLAMMAGLSLTMGRVGGPQSDFAVTTGY